MKNDANLNAFSALEWMKQGCTLKQTNTGTLFAMRYEKVLVSMASCTLRLQPQDFLQLYEQQTFRLHEQEAGIDEKKDQDYYAWAARYQ